MLTVGSKKIIFNIHEDLLEIKTSFFNVHPTPNGGTVSTCPVVPGSDPVPKRETSPDTGPNLPESGSQASTPMTGTAKTDPDTSRMIASVLTSPTNAVESFAISTEREEVAVDYHLDIHYDRAFAIFVDWLYNTPPNDPATSSQCKILIQAYLIALKYSAVELQNLLIECIRRYHSSKQVDFDMLFIYLLNRYGDDPDCKLIGYLVDQIAYEIAEEGIEKFHEHNAGFDNFLRHRPGGGLVRGSLVWSLAIIASSAKSGDRIMDPATKKKHDYHLAPEAVLQRK